MNKEQTQEIITLLQGIKWSEDGERALNVEYLERGTDIWCETDKPYFEFSTYKYRLKPEPKYVPFTFEDDLVGKVVMNKMNKRKSLIIEQSDKGIRFYGSFYSFADLFDDFTFLDGSICGKEVR